MGSLGGRACPYSAGESVWVVRPDVLNGWAMKGRYGLRGGEGTAFPTDRVRICSVSEEKYGLGDVGGIGRSGSLVNGVDLSSMTFGFTVFSQGDLQLDGDGFRPERHGDLGLYGHGRR